MTERGSGGSVGRRLATRLPVPRGPALLEAGRALRTVVTGRGVGPMTVLLQRVDAALARRDGDGALALLEPALAASPWRRDVLERHAQTSRLRRDAPALLRSLSRLAQLSDASVTGELRRVAGMLVATEPGWVPRVPPRGPGLDAGRAGGVVRVLLGEPGHAPTTADVQALDRWLAETDGPDRHGLIVPLGAPLAAGTNGGATLVGAGVTYPADAPLADAIRDHAWLTIRALAPLRPPLAIVDGPWYAAIVAAALHEALGVAVAVGRCAEPPTGMFGEARARTARTHSLDALDAAAPPFDPSLASIAAAARAGRPTRAA